MQRRGSDADLQREENDPQTYAIIGAAVTVHNHHGCGFREPVYHESMLIELQHLGIPFSTEVRFPLTYRDRLLQSVYRADLICFESVVVELKVVQQFVDEHVSQVLNYLKASRLRRGLLINFAKPKLEWKRIVLGFEEEPFS